MTGAAKTSVVLGDFEDSELEFRRICDVAAGAMVKPYGRGQLRSNQAATFDES